MHGLIRIAVVVVVGGMVGGPAWSHDQKAGQTRVQPRYSFPGSEAIAQDRITGDLGYLCSDYLEGRNSGEASGRRAGDWLVAQLTWLGMQPAGSNGYYQPFSVRGRNMRNILCTIPGSGGSGEAVFIGAHYDHLGTGYHPGAFGSRGQIHNGADDNGSGTTAVLQIIRAFKKSNRQYHRRIIFAFFDGEERGLLGSKHWVRNRTVRDRIVLMINLDMVGRLGSSLEITHNGGQRLRQYIQTANRDTQLRTRNGRNIQPDSDHFPFYQQRIPVLIPFTGMHRNYHRPSDDLELINTKGIEQIARLSFGVAVQAANDTSQRLRVEGPVHKIDMDAIIAGCHHYHTRAGVDQKEPNKRPRVAKTSALKRTTLKRSAPQRIKKRKRRSRRR